MAHWLKDRGFDAYAVVGGAAALTGQPVVESTDPSFADDVELAAGRALAVLRHRTFRIFSIGVIISLVGGAVEAAAFGYVVLLIGGSAATLGLIGFLNTIPNLLVGLPAGVLADRYDRRKLLLTFQALNLAVSAALAVLYATDRLTIATMGALAVVGGTLGTLSFPAFQGMLGSTVPRFDLEGAVAVNSLSLQVARLVGPAIAGVLLAAAGPTWVFGVNAASFAFVLVALLLLPPSRATAVAMTQAAGGLVRSMTDALRYVFGQRSIACLMVMMLLAGIFATPPVAFMLPAIARDQLDGGGGTLGALAASIGLGAVLGSIALLRLARRPNKGEPLILGFLLAGAAVALIGVSTSLPLSLALAVVGGFSGVLFVGLSTVVVQAASSDEMRARAMAIWAVAFVGMLPFGALITGGLAAWLGAGGAVLVDGLIVVVGGVAASILRPEVRWLGCAALPEACIAATSPAAAAIVRAEARPLAR